MTKSIVKQLFEFKRKNGKFPALIVVGEPQHCELERERHRILAGQKNPSLYVGGGVYIESIMGVKLIRDKTLDGVYFAEEQVLK